MEYVESFDLFGTKVSQVPCIKGKGAPTTATTGAVGCLYMDTNTGTVYKCTDAESSVYTWETFSSGGGGGGGSAEGAVLYTKQTITDAQKEQARENIGACSFMDVAELICEPFTVSGALVECTPIVNYPLTVNSAEGATKIFRTGKNLFDFKHEDPTLQAGPDRYGFEITLPAGTYTVSANDLGVVDLTVSTNARYLRVLVYKTDGTNETYNVVNGSNTDPKKVIKPQTFALEDGGRLVIYNSSAKASEKGNLTGTKKLFRDEFDVQIEAGSTKTDYEPYNGGGFAPGAEITALSGTNYIWADEGDVEVSGIESAEIEPRLSLTSSIPNSTQTVAFNSDGTLKQVLHKDASGAVVRTDNYTYSGNTITETRTLATGESMIFVLDTETLTMEVK